MDVPFYKIVTVTIVDINVKQSLASCSANALGRLNKSTHNRFLTLKLTIITAKACHRKLM